MKTELTNELDRIKEFEKEEAIRGVYILLDISISCFLHYHSKEKFKEKFCDIEITLIIE
jgi:hypothetical protein